jgi:hypothetical protein
MGSRCGSSPTKTSSSSASPQPPWVRDERAGRVCAQPGPGAGRAAASGHPGGWGTTHESRRPGRLPSACLRDFIEPTTFRLRVEEPSASVCRPDPFWLLKSEGSPVECVPDLSCYGWRNDQESACETARWFGDDAGLELVAAGVTLRMPDPCGVLGRSCPLGAAGAGPVGAAGLLEELDRPRQRACPVTVLPCFVPDRHRPRHPPGKEHNAMAMLADSVEVVIGVAG